MLRQTQPSRSFFATFKVLSSLATGVSDIEKRGLAVALQDDVETVGAAFAAVRDEAPPRGCVLDRGEQGVGHVRRLAGEINPRVELPQQSPGEEGDVDMRRLQGVAATRDW